MDSSNLITISMSAFVTVFFVLSLIAILMRLIINFFPVKYSDGDMAVIAAVSSVLNKIYPGTKVTKIEEMK